MDEPNVLNIPAYQRKRSIAAKARKRPQYALQRKPVRHKSPTFRKRSIKRHPPRSVTEISIKPSLPSEELFPNPLLEIEEIKPASETELREMTICGMCEGYFDNIEVAVIKLTSPLREGDTIIFEQQDGLFEQKVNSMQINRKPVSLARTGSDIGLKVLLQPKVGTPVYKVI